MIKEQLQDRDRLNTVLSYIAFTYRRLGVTKEFAENKSFQRDQLQTSYQMMLQVFGKQDLLWQLFNDKFSHFQQYTEIIKKYEVFIKNASRNDQETIKFQFGLLDKEKVLINESMILRLKSLKEKNLILALQQEPNA